ncbi:MAG: WYL domain-containing protein [Vampirovibrio sp.]
MQRKFGQSRTKQKNHIRTIQPSLELLHAVQERKIVTFDYGDLREGFLYREVEPHACGVFENGRTVLVGYQIGGQSKSHGDPPWRTFSIEKIRNLVVTDRVFPNNRPDYNPLDRRLNPVFAKV